MIESLPILILNPHNRCNCRCTMCDIWKATSVQEISAEALEQQLESIAGLGVEWVVLSGGEPLMHSNLWELCAMLRRLNIRITLLSSGLLLRRHAESIVENVDDLIVSLDGPREVHNSIRGVPRVFELLESGVRAIRHLDSEFEISARCTVQRSNFRHLTASAEAAYDLRLDSISFLAADLQSSAFNRPDGWPAEKRAEVGLSAADVSLLELEIEALIARGECSRFIRESPAKLRKIACHFRAHLGSQLPVAPQCNAPWNSAVIDADGAVRPCYFHPPIGHLNSGLPIDEIVNSPEAVAFRESLDVASNPICQKCVCSLNWRSN